FELVYLGVHSAEENLGCVNNLLYTPTYSKSVPTKTYNDMGTLDIGYVCNTGKVNMPEADMLIVEIVVRLRPDAVVTLSENLLVNAAITSNGQTSQLFSVTFTVGDALAYIGFEKNEDPTSPAMLNSS
ncbi:hypothetical protein EGW08_015433, partial [Elysia chlorotica]